MSQFVKLNPEALKQLRTINPALVSYNVEMTEVTGGTFWKVYTPEQSGVYCFTGNAKHFSPMKQKIRSTE